MLEADQFIGAALANDFAFFTGVPCSYLSPLINRVISRTDTRYVGATSEGEAVAIAAGAWLGGRQTVVMCQNSGLGNTINPLTSLNFPFRIPTLLIVTWRGKPGEPDEPQHALMGRITRDLIDLVDVPQCLFPTAEAEIEPFFARARRYMNEEGRSFAMVMSRDNVTSLPLNEVPRTRHTAITEYNDLTTGGVRPARRQVLEQVLGDLPQEDAVVATTGKCGRELFTLQDRDQHFYQVGSMGAASALGLGVALTANRRVVVLDGDGAALMKLGNLATIGAYQPSKFVHILLDNGVHDSTGGQSTVSSTVDFAAVALACGYTASWVCDDIPGFRLALANSGSKAGPVLIHMRISPGSMIQLGRPTLAPHEVAQRFRTFVTGGADPLRHSRSGH